MITRSPGDEARSSASHRPSPRKLDVFAPPLATLTTPTTCAGRPARDARKASAALSGAARWAPHPDIGVSPAGQLATVESPASRTCMMAPWCVSDGVFQRLLLRVQLVHLCDHLVAALGVPALDLSLVLVLGVLAGEVLQPGVADDLVQLRTLGPVRVRDQGVRRVLDLSL